MNTTIYTQQEASTLVDKILIEKQKTLLYLLKYSNDESFQIPENSTLQSLGQKIKIESEFTIDISSFSDDIVFTEIVDYLIEYLNSLGFNINKGSISEKNSAFSIKFNKSPGDYSNKIYEFIINENGEEEKFEDGIIKLKSQIINISDKDKHNIHTILHEMMHALGLEHSGDYNGDESTSFIADLYNVIGVDSVQLSVMSYAQPFSLIGLAGYVNNMFVHGDYISPASLMMSDFLAIKNVYSKSNAPIQYNTGDNNYDFSKIPMNSLVHALGYTIYDEGGYDILDISIFSGDYINTINLNDGHASSIGGYTNNLFIGFDTNIEEIRGSTTDDHITGKNIAEVFYGLSGDDKLYGSGGVDVFMPGEGDDLIDGGSSTWTSHDGQSHNHSDLVDYTKLDHENQTTYTTSNVFIETCNTLVYHTSQTTFETDTLIDIEHVRFGDQDVTLNFTSATHQHRLFTSGTGNGIIDFAAVATDFVGTWSSSDLTLASAASTENGATLTRFEGFDAWKAGAGTEDTLVISDHNATLATRTLGTLFVMHEDKGVAAVETSYDTLAIEGVERFVLATTIGTTPNTAFTPPAPGTLPAGITFTVHDPSDNESRTLDFSGHTGRILWRANQSVEHATTVGTNGWTYSGTQATFLNIPILDWWTGQAVGSRFAFAHIIGTAQADALQGVVGQTLDAGAGTDHINIMGADTVTGGEGADVFRWNHTAVRTGAQSNVQVISDFSLDDTFVAGAMAGNQVSWLQTTDGATMTHIASGRKIFFEGALQADIMARTIFENGRMWVGTHANDTDNRSSSIDGWALHGLGGIDHLYGGRGEDKLYGGQDNDRLWGNDNHDMLYGGTGNDSLYGGSNNDNLWGGEGDDLLHSGHGYATWVQNLHGEAGNDTLDLTGAYGGDAYGGAGNDSIWGGGMVTSANLNAFGGDGDDRMRGAKGVTTESILRGGNGNDWIDGSFIGMDTLYGDAGHDLLFAMGHGNIATDIMFGGTGRDVFAIAAAPRQGMGSGHIRDFDLDEDKLHIDPDMITAWNRATRTQSGSNLVITFEGGTNITPNRLIVDGVTWDELASATQLGGSADALWMSLW